MREFPDFSGRQGVRDADQQAFGGMCPNRRHRDRWERWKEAQVKQIGTMATEAVDLLIEAVERTPTESWDQPSNLEDWSVRDLVGHAHGSAAKIVTLVEDGRSGSAPSRPTGYARTRTDGFVRWLFGRVSWRLSVHKFTMGV